MRFYDNIDPQTLERREAHLSILAIVVIAVMSIGMAAAMYPLVFAHPITPETETARRAFYGFCVLSILMVTYLTNRHIVIRRLRKKIADGQERIKLVQRQASADLLRTLPGMSQFQDRLTMEFRRCARTGDRLSLLLVLASVNQDILNEGEIANIFGDVAKALLVKMRKDDAIYGFRPGGFGILLVAPAAAPLAQICDRLAKSLEEARHSSGRFSFATRIVNYPEQTKTAWEMEEAARNFIPVEQSEKAASTSTPL
jgi:GGDEF domain-containing protein